MSDDRPQRPKAKAGLAIDRLDPRLAHQRRFALGRPARSSEPEAPGPCRARPRPGSPPRLRFGDSPAEASRFARTCPKPTSERPRRSRRTGTAGTDPGTRGPARCRGFASEPPVQGWGRRGAGPTLPRATVDRRRLRRSGGGWCVPAGRAATHRGRDAWSSTTPPPILGIGLDALVLNAPRRPASQPRRQSDTRHQGSNRPARRG